MAHTGAHLDLSAFASPEELSTLGLDRLKSALIALGLKCGGTLQVIILSFADLCSRHPLHFALHSNCQLLICKTCFKVKTELHCSLA